MFMIYPDGCLLETRFLSRWSVVEWGAKMPWNIRQMRGALTNGIECNASKPGVVVGDGLRRLKSAHCCARAN